MTRVLQIVEASDADLAEWDAFIQASPAATFFHRFGWRNVIKRTYGYSSCYLMAKRGGRIEGVLPLIDVTSPIFGRNLISTAFTVGGGIVAGDAAARSALAEAAVEEGRKRRVKYVELRSRTADLEGWAVKDSVYAGFEKLIPQDADENLKEIPRKRRAEVRKAIASLEAGEVEYHYTKDVEPFYGLYAFAMREHGTPVFPRRFASEQMREFGEDAEILVITAGGEAVLSLLTFNFRDYVLPYYFAAGPRAREFRAFDLAIWLQMRRGAERGARIFDFGRAKFGAGSFDYKMHWGFEPAALGYQYALIGARETPNVNPNNPKFARVSEAWKRLPLPVANLAGPLLARHLA